MEEISKDTVRCDAPLVIALAALWACLHASPYYPFGASPAFAGADTGVIAAHHTWYSVALVVLLAALLALRWKAPARVTAGRAPAIAAGAAGVLAGALIASGVCGGSVADCAACALAAVPTAYFSVVLLAQATALGPRRGAFAVALSYCAFSACWLLLELASHDAALLVPVVCPAVCAAGVVLQRDGGALAGVGEARPAPGAYRTLPWTVLGLSCAFVWFSAVSVRLFTAMEQGAVRSGALAGLPYAITAGAGLVLAGALLLLIWRRGLSPAGGVAAFSLLTLTFMGALLLVMVSPGTQVTLVGRRLMVAVEHAFHLLVAVLLVVHAARSRLDSFTVFGVFGIAVLALPQLVSLDLMHAAGVLDAAAGRNLVLPIAGGAAFFVAASVVLLLMRSNRQVVAQAALSNDDWQRALCMRAAEGLDITGRELDVLVLTYRGLSAKKAAEELYVSESTVKSHLQHIYRKMAVHSKQELIARVDACKEG